MSCSLVTVRSIDAIALGKFKALFLHGFLAQASPKISTDFFSALIRQKMLDRERMEWAERGRGISTLYYFQRHALPPSQNIKN
jgi:hypothetical protein